MGVHPFSTADSIFNYLVTALLSLPLPFLVIYDVPYKHKVMSVSSLPSLEVRSELTALLDTKRICHWLSGHFRSIKLHIYTRVTSMVFDTRIIVVNEIS